MALSNAFLLTALGRGFGLQGFVVAGGDGMTAEPHSSYFSLPFSPTFTASGHSMNNAWHWLVRG